MKVALAQINPTVGDIEGNCQKIADFHQRAVAAGAELTVFPELALVGYPPLDLVSRDDFVERCHQALGQLATQLAGVPALVGCVLRNPEASGRPIQNAAVLLADGQLRFVQAKSRLPSYDVFDEERYFEAAQEQKPLEIGGQKIGVTICEDIWAGPEDDRRRYPFDPVAELATQGVDFLVNLSASPFHAGKGKEREEVARSAAAKASVPLLLVNQVGGNDSLLFDGRSLAIAADGRVFARAEAFSEDLIIADLETGKGDMRPEASEGEAELFRAIVMGLRDYMEKCGFTRAVLGLSGGIDSAVTAVLAAEAAGAYRVQTLAMPSPYSSPHSRRDAEELARRLEIDCAAIPITPMLDAYRQSLSAAMGDIKASLTEENLQARIRGALVMAFGNQQGALALATGNKSELATGYCTMYGDMAGGLAPIGDLLKGQVYQMANFINRQEEIIPRRIIERPPSAELRPDQCDQDSLPPYEQLDAILALHLTERLGQDAIVAHGYPTEVVSEVIQMVARTEFKRRQAPPVLRVTRQAFGEGRRIPIARGLMRKSPAK